MLTASLPLGSTGRKAAAAVVRATTSHVATRSRLTRADPARTRALRDGDAHVSKGRPAKRLVRARPHGEGAYGPPRRRTRTRRAPQVGRGTAARRSCSALGWEMSRRARDAEGGLSRRTMDWTRLSPRGRVWSWLRLRGLSRRRRRPGGGRLSARRA